MTTDVVLSIYPLYRSFQIVKQHNGRRVESMMHWMIFWQVFFLLHFADAMVDKTSALWSWIPLSGVVWSVYCLGRTALIVCCYSPKVTYVVYNTGLKFLYREIARCTAKWSWLHALRNRVDTFVSELDTSTLYTRTIDLCSRFMAPFNADVKMKND